MHHEDKVGYPGGQGHYIFWTRILNKLAWSFGKMRGLMVGEALGLVPNIKEKKNRREGETKIKPEAVNDF